MFLSCSAKKGTKEGVIGEALRKCALPYVPHPPPRQPAFKNIPIFERLQLKNLQLFSQVDFRKSEHFRESDGVAAGGVHRGGRICVAPPLCRILWFLSWRDKKGTLPQLDEWNLSLLHK
jgi:hypothetical protein